MSVNLKERMEQGLLRWRGKVALVTGATSGIGTACARALAPVGMRLALAGRRGERLEELKAELEGAHGAAGCEVMVIVGDIADPGHIAAMTGGIRQAWGGMDVLINNAGLGHTRPLTESDWEPLQQMLDVNIRAATLCMQEAVKDMRGKQDAAIINISSLAGHRVVAGSITTSFYAATKHAMRGMTEGVRNELRVAGEQIKIGTISPGLVVTEFHQAAAPSEPPKGYPFNPLQAEDIASAVLYMLSTQPHVQVGDVVLRSVEQPF